MRVRILRDGRLQSPDFRRLRGVNSGVQFRSTPDSAQKASGHDLCGRRDRGKAGRLPVRLIDRGDAVQGSRTVDKGERYGDDR